MASVYTEIDVTTVGRTGALIAIYEDAGVNAGNRFQNDGETMLLVINDGAGAVNITPVLPPTVHGDTVTFVSNAAVPAGVLTVPTLEHRVYGPFEVDRFNWRSGDDQGYVTFTMDDNTGVTLLAFK